MLPVLLELVILLIQLVVDHNLEHNAADPFIQLQQDDESLESALLFNNQPPETGPRVLFSPSQNKMFVNGALYDADDAQSALDAESSRILR